MRPLATVDRRRRRVPSSSSLSSAALLGLLLCGGGGGGGHLLCVEACSCLWSEESDTPAYDALLESASVFEGTVLSVERVDFRTRRSRGRRQLANLPPGPKYMTEKVRRTNKIVKQSKRTEEEETFWRSLQGGCPEVAKLCPDGTVVTQVFINDECQWEPCPVEDPIADQVFCTEDAKLCPDGSSVGRDPENGCEFFPCPDEVVEPLPAEKPIVTDEPPVFCTADVHECPDGTYVSRDPKNNCEWFPCPDEVVDPLPLEPIEPIDKPILVEEPVDTIDHRDKLVLFRVRRVWKGGRVPRPPPSEFYVKTGPYGAMCGIHFEVGKTYMVYTNAGYKDGPEGAYSCGRTSMFDPNRPEGRAYSDAEELGDWTLRDVDGTCLPSADVECLGIIVGADPSQGCTTPDCLDLINPPPPDGGPDPPLVPFQGGPIWADLDKDGILTGLDRKLAGIAVQITDALGKRHAVHTDAEGIYRIGAGVATGKAKVKVGYMSLPKVPTRPTTGAVWKQTGETTNPMPVDVQEERRRLISLTKDQGGQDQDRDQDQGQEHRSLQDASTQVMFQEALCSDLTACSECLKTFPACAWSDDQCADACIDGALPCRQIPHPYEGMATPEDMCNPNTVAGTCATDQDCRLLDNYCDGCHCRGILKAAVAVDNSCKPGVPTVNCLVNGCFNKVARCELGVCVARDETPKIDTESTTTTTTTTPLGNQGTDPTTGVELNPAAPTADDAPDNDVGDVGALKTAIQPGHQCNCARRR